MWNVPGSAQYWPDTNSVERAILRGALRLAQRGVCMTEHRELIIRIIRDAWLAANLCRDAGLVCSPPSAPAVPTEEVPEVLLTEGRRQTARACSRKPNEDL